MNSARIPDPGMSPAAPVEDGHDLWLRYRLIKDADRRRDRRRSLQDFFTEIVVENASASAALAVVRKELCLGLNGLLGRETPISDRVMKNGAVAAGTPASSSLIRKLRWDNKLEQLGDEGFLIAPAAVRGCHATVIASSGEAGALYGVFAFLRLIQTGRWVAGLRLEEKPRIALRMLNHWETIRCYAGGNVWHWDELPGRVDPKYKIYARACASIGLNGLVLNNVNAGREYLTQAFLEKEKALADLFRPFGVRVWLSANFSAPVTVGGHSTADPLEPAVLDWWKAKVDEIYSVIPDFGGFVVKANSEGEPGPKDYGRNHAEGANLLARALAPHGGLVLWRAFVYDAEKDPDRLKRAYKEFTPLDGEFEKNVIVQVKNGPLDFQPREPFNPLFGKMPRTPLAMEFQITQEYLGQDTHLVYLAPMWKEVLDADTGGGFTVSQVIDGSAHASSLTAIAGVANTGSDRNWCGHHFHQANWYAFGRLAWDHRLSAENLADEWIRMTWGSGEQAMKTIKAMMTGSHKACVDYMTPLGLGHIMARDHHYGPQPDDTVPGHEDWSPTYYHRADANGLGCDRSHSGSGLTAQYFPAVGSVFDDIDTCPENLLCWFHHVPWKRKMKSGRTFWDELCFRYGRGVRYVSAMRAQWETLKEDIDPGRFLEVRAKLEQQEADAKRWRDVCLGYFQKFSKLPIPKSEP